MRKWIYFLVLIIPIGCSTKRTDSDFTPEKAKWFFSKVKEICDLDAGKLWGKNLYGPLMFVDRQTKKIYSNSPDAEGILKPKSGIYTGSFPKEVVLDNAGIIIGGTLFGTVPVRQGDDTFRLLNRAVHGLFHAFRKNSGIKPSGTYISRMDDKGSRILLKLEWKALEKAINGDDSTRVRALTDALIFRNARRAQYPQETIEENNFECWEGLTTFTFTLLCSKSAEDAKKELLSTLDRTYRFQSYSRSYGFIHGALYAWLAYQKGFDFSTIKSDSTDIGKITGELYKTDSSSNPVDAAKKIAAAYNTDTINIEEDQRALKIRQDIHRQIAGFTDNPVVYLELESPYFDFEPEEISSLDTLGTIYSTIRVSDNWGKLTVEKGGCLVSSNLHSMRIPAKDVNETKNHITGDGWHIILNDEWHMVKKNENYFIKKLMP